VFENAAAWSLIVLSLIAANAPFLTERPLLVLPWSRQSTRAPWSRWVVAFSLLAALACVCWLAQWWIGQAVTGSRVQILLRVVFVVAATVVLLVVPGWYLGRTYADKPFVHRLLELLVLYGLIGMLGFAVEANLGSVFPQRWEFYAVSLSLFLVMAYPGFVVRYLFKRRKPSRAAVGKTAHGKYG